MAHGSNRPREWQRKRTKWFRSKRPRIASALSETPATLICSRENHSHPGTPAPEILRAAAVGRFAAEVIVIHTPVNWANCSTQPAGTAAPGVLYYPHEKQGIMHFPHHKQGLLTRGKCEGLPAGEVLHASNEAQRLQPHRLLPSHLLALRLGRATKPGPEERNQQEGWCCPFCKRAQA
jgi:hypothetical protein